MRAGTLIGPGFNRTNVELKQEQGQGKYASTRFNRTNVELKRRSHCLASPPRDGAF